MVEYVKVMESSFHFFLSQTAWVLFLKVLDIVCLSWFLKAFWHCVFIRIFTKKWTECYTEWIFMHENLYNIYLYE